jgi:hypothetical protein
MTLSIFVSSLGISTKYLIFKITNKKIKLTTEKHKLIGTLRWVSNIHMKTQVKYITLNSKLIKIS